MDILDKSPNKTEVTRDVIKRAKEAGVNVSGIISQLQRALADQRIEGHTVNDVVDIDAKNKEEAENRANKYLNNLSTFDFNEGTCNHYEIDMIGYDWVEQKLVQ